MAKALRSYMKEEITAFELDDALTEASAATSDKTAEAMALALWFHYDDVDDHKIVASKQQWDYFNRILLLLESNAEMRTITSGWKWHPHQAVAAVFLLAFVYIAVHVGWGVHLFAYALPFGPPSMLLAWLNSRRRTKELGPDETALTPFPSVGCLLKVRRNADGFMKTPYPRGPIAERRIRGLIPEMLFRVRWSIIWCLFSPIGLFLQMLPERESEVRIETLETSAGL